MTEERGREARPLLGLVLAGHRISFEPVWGGYVATVPIAFDQSS